MSGAGTALLRARGLRKDYGKGEGLVRAVDEVDLDVATGETLAVMGPSGCGKSTLLHLLGGLDRPSAGEVWLKYQVGLFSRTLATLLTGGLPLVPSLETAARSIESRQISKAVYTSVEGVREGQGLSTSLEETGVFPELSVEMIEVGESTGALPASVWAKSAAASPIK